MWMPRGRRSFQPPGASHRVIFVLRPLLYPYKKGRWGARSVVGIAVFHKIVYWQSTRTDPDHDPDRHTDPGRDEKGTIVVEPFDPGCLGSNSYDVHLGRNLAVYRDEVLDARAHNQVDYMEIPDEGLILLPHRFYLGVTEEYTETHRHVPFLEGKSSIGRLGSISMQPPAKGDIGFCNTWTLEISVKQPVRVYPGMPIGQLIYFEMSGAIAPPTAERRPSMRPAQTNLLNP